MTVIPKALHCGHCGEDILLTEEFRDANPAHPELEEVRHVRDCPPWEPRGPISDGTLPCPVTHNGKPCTKTIHKGWRENEGHAGGHWFETPEDREFFRTAHYDIIAMASGLPFTPHTPEDCPDPWECHEKGWDRT
jgi:hypothetical protein